MIYTIISLFALTAILGTVLLAFVLQNKETPKGVTFSHGSLAVAGLILIIIYAFMESPGPIEAIILFVIAAGGGIVMLIRDLSGKSVPKWLAIVHGVLAVAGFAFLLVFAFT